MERYIMFLDWKNQYCGNDYTTQRNLRRYYFSGALEDVRNSPLCGCKRWGRGCWWSQGWRKCCIYFRDRTHRTWDEKEEGIKAEGQVSWLKQLGQSVAVMGTALGSWTGGLHDSLWSAVSTPWRSCYAPGSWTL